MGMLARSAPALNLFAVGFPATLLAGLVLLAIAAPVMGEGIVGAIQEVHSGRTASLTWGFATETQLAAVRREGPDATV